MPTDFIKSHCFFKVSLFQISALKLQPSSLFLILTHFFSSGEGGKSDVIDLTQDRDEKEDLQRAIALSLQETTQASIGVSAEEQDISR